MDTNNAASGNTEKTQDEMSFWDHLEELRWHIIRSLIAVFLLGILAFLNKKIIFDDILFAPLSDNFISYRALCVLGNYLNTDLLCLSNQKLELINIDISGQFMTHLYVSFMAGLTLAIPYVIQQLWSFIKPALHDNEKKNTRGVVWICSSLFILGVLFSYFIIVPLTVNFLGNYQTSSMVANQVHLRSYIGTIISLCFSVGVVFELPVLVFFLTKIGLLTSSYLKKNRKYTFVILLVLSAIITPPDVFSQIIVVIPLMLLYEAGIIIASRTEVQRIEN